MERILLILSFLNLAVLAVKAGTCFRSQSTKGKCIRPIVSRINRSACCERGGMYFTYENYVNWFIVQVRNNGANNCTRTCGRRNSCADLVCRRNQICIIEDGIATCRCQVRCNQAQYLRQVCASDGETYSSECAMERMKCARGDLITRVNFYGHCQTVRTHCSSDFCPFGKVCVIGMNLRPHCQIRIMKCSEWSNDEAVCGSDGVSYPSECYLRMVSQRRGREIGFTRGNCPSTQRPRSVSSLRWLSL